MQQVFTLTIRVYYEDTDAAGVVYYANYLKYMERARTEWLRSLGFEQDEIARRDGVMFVVRSAAMEFIKPARFNEAIDVGVAIADRGGASIVFSHNIKRDHTVLCTADVRVACVELATYIPRALPGALASRLEEMNL
jgi:acyl-CoA thioester hydrolase